jgi:hypothetical protein
MKCGMGDEDEGLVARFGHCVQINVCAAGRNWKYFPKALFCPFKAIRASRNYSTGKRTLKRDNNGWNMRRGTGIGWGGDETNMKALPAQSENSTLWKD